jgi:hypothetical protein
VIDIDFEFWPLNSSQYPKATYFKIAIGIQATAWMGSTAIGFMFAVRQRTVSHREWMIRSYAVTFVATRMFQPIPSWNHPVVSDLHQRLCASLCRLL